MQRYETLLLARTEISDSDLSMIEKQFDQIISQANGKLDSFDKWGKYRLAYTIKKDSHGVYVLVRYQIPEQSTAAIINELDRFLKIKCNEIVLRHVNVRLKPQASSIYIKPDPIDITRSGSFDTFFKDNKIESLLSSVDTAGAHNGDDAEINNNDQEQS